MGPGAEMKGAAFYSMIAAIGELDGAEAQAGVVAALPEPIGSVFRSGALARVGWYPLEHYGLVHEAIQAVLGGGERRARDLGRKSTEIDTRGLLRYVLALTTPSLLVRHANRVFGSYIRGGTVTAAQRDLGIYDVTFSNMSGASRYVLAEWEGGISFLLEVAGAKAVNVRRAAATADEHGNVAMVATWSTASGR